MNMPRINQWFKEHPDAILVTDKVNSPKTFTDKEGFAYKNRLIMELFSWEAVKEAIAENITPMPSGNLIFNDPDIEKKLKKLKIKHIAISVNEIDNNRDLLKRLKQNGIKTYVFALNSTPGKDEKYVWENEMDYVYGMYADNLDII